MIFTVPYSPPTNGPFENFFGIVKFEYDVRGITIDGDPEEVLFRVQEVIKSFIKDKIDVIIDPKYYHHIINQWNECKCLKPLSANKVELNVDVQKNVRAINTKRFMGTAIPK